jgi:hydrogenase expression/formation protein HypC
LVAIEPNTLGARMGTVEFAGIRTQVCLDFVPDVNVGEYVTVHVGFAIGRVDEAEAAKVFALLADMDELGELDLPRPE